MIINKKDKTNKLLKKLGISNYYIDEDLRVSVSGSVFLSGLNLTDLPLNFNIVEKDFLCNDNRLTSLKGCPEIVYGNFNISDNKLVNLNYFPKCVNKSIILENNKLTSLKGCPEVINGDFNCSYNLLTSLNYFPLVVKNNLYILGNNFDFENDKFNTVVKGDFIFNDITFDKVSKILFIEEVKKNIAKKESKILQNCILKDVIRKYKKIIL